MNFSQVTIMSRETFQVQYRDSEKGPIHVLPSIFRYVSYFGTILQKIYIFRKPKTDLYLYTICQRSLSQLNLKLVRGGGIFSFRIMKLVHFGGILVGLPHNQIPKLVHFGGLWWGFPKIEVGGFSEIPKSDNFSRYLG